MVTQTQGNIVISGHASGKVYIFFIVEGMRSILKELCCCRVLEFYALREIVLN